MLVIGLKNYHFICEFLDTHYIFFKILFVYFRQSGREVEREGEKHHVVASCMPPTGDLSHNPGMCSDWESNQRPYGLQAGTQSTEPHQPGLDRHYIKHCIGLLI